MLICTPLRRGSLPPAPRWSPRPNNPRSPSQARPGPWRAQYDAKIVPAISVAAGCGSPVRLLWREKSRSAYLSATLCWKSSATAGALLGGVDVAQRQVLVRLCSVAAGLMSPAVGAAVLRSATDPCQTSGTASACPKRRPTRGVATMGVTMQAAIGPDSGGHALRAHGHPCTQRSCAAPDGCRRQRCLMQTMKLS